VRKTTGKILALGTMATVAVAVSASPAAAADKTIRSVKGVYGISGEYWYKSGSSTRGLNSVGAHKSDLKKKSTLYARWLYKKPGGTYKVGKSWKKATLTRVYDGTYDAHAGWGKNDSHTGPKFPKNTVICTQFKGSSTKVCATLK
jgi:hypothetical protein